MKVDDLKREREARINEWKTIRNKKIHRKKILQDKGLDIADIRKEKTYKTLKKKQASISLKIKRINKRINRISERNE